jgi:hypothetical protein
MAAYRRRRLAGCFFAGPACPADFARVLAPACVRDAVGCFAFTRFTGLATFVAPFLAGFAPFADAGFAARGSDRYCVFVSVRVAGQEPPAAQATVVVVWCLETSLYPHPCCFSTGANTSTTIVTTVKPRVLALLILTSFPGSYCFPSVESCQVKRQRPGDL